MTISDASFSAIEVRGLEGKLTNDRLQDQVLSEHPGPPVISGLALRGAYTNPLFGLPHYLYRYEGKIDVARFRKQVGTKVNTTIEEVRVLPYKKAQLLAYGYRLCRLMDETVMKTLWGRYQ